MTDFGIARATTSSNTISTNVMGSVHYTSPEQARGGVVDEKSDIYSAGVTMYEMVTGHVPFDGDSTVSVAIKHLQEEIISPAVEVPDIPKSLEKIIIKCTQKSTAMRYQNCEELILDLKRSLMDPEGSFMSGGSGQPASDATVIMDTQEIARVQSQDYLKEYDDPDDDDDYDYDERYDNRYEERRSSDGKRYAGRVRKEDVNPQMKKVMKVLMIVAAVIIAFALIFGVSRALGAFRTGTDTTVEKDTKVKVPDLLGKTESEAKEELKKYNLGYQIIGRETSDKYDKGEILSQDPSSGTEVEKNQTIKIKISTGAEPKEVSVPDVRGKAQANAQKILEDANLVVNTEFSFSDSVENGSVISTNPEAGTTVEEGSSVTMYVSKGKEQISVPDVAGSDVDTAAGTLQSAGLNLGSEVSSEYSDTLEAGMIIRTEPEAGKKVDKGTSVNYVISKGKKVEMVTVPNLSNKDESAARQALIDAGLTVGDVKFEYSSVTEGYVISQTASSGSQVEKGSAVGFTISLGPEKTDGKDEGKKDNTSEDANDSNDVSTYNEN